MIARNDDISDYNKAIEKLADAYYTAWGGRVLWGVRAVVEGLHVPLPESEDMHRSQKLPSPLNLPQNSGVTTTKVKAAASTVIEQLGPFVNSFHNAKVNEQIDRAIVMLKAVIKSVEQHEKLQSL